MIVSLGLVGAYICLSVIALLLFIRSNTHYIAKSLLVVLVIWYGLALYYTPSNIMGWPVSVEAGKIPNNSKIISFRIQEPRQDNVGGIYFWLNTEPIQTNFTMMQNMSPKVFFSYYGHKDPRAYKIPYTRKLHETLMKVRKSQKGVPGSFITIKTLEGKETERGTKLEGDIDKEQDDQLEFRITNPATILRKGN